MIVFKTCSRVVFSSLSFTADRDEKLQLYIKLLLLICNNNKTQRLFFRREWDVFVAADHPDSSPLPQSWVLPDPPSDQDWASALQAADGDGDGL